jgi:hypothetical protein
MSQSGTYGLNKPAPGTTQFIEGNGGGEVGPNAEGVIFILGAGNISVTGNPGDNTLTITTVPDVLEYTYVNTTPYVVLATDQFLGVDSSAQPITIQLPNGAAEGRIFTIKDYAGSAGTNFITITTPGGTTTIDGATSYILLSTYSSIDVLFDGSNYLVY